MSILGHLLRFLAIIVTGLFSKQDARGAEEGAKSDPDDIGGSRG